jgi:hypothetical protein
VAFQMALQSSRHRRPEWDPAAIAHEETRGCWGDVGGRQVAVAAILRAGDLCPECRRIYEAAGVDVTTFLHFVTAVREMTEATG